MKKVDIHELQRRLAQARADCVWWAEIGQRSRLQEAQFVAATLALRIRHRQSACDWAGPAEAQAVELADRQRRGLTRTQHAPAPADRTHA
jgi:hypothetical protein